MGAHRRPQRRESSRSSIDLQTCCARLRPAPGRFARMPRRESGRVVEEARQEASAIVAEARTRASHVQQQATKALQRSKDAADTFNARWVEYREPLVHELSDLRERLRVALDSLALMPEPPSTHDEPLIASVEAGAMEELTSAEP